MQPGTRKQIPVLIRITVMVQFMKTFQNTPGTAGGPGGRDRTVAAYLKKIFFLHISSSYAKNWGKQIFTHGSFPKWVKSRRRRRKRRKKKKKKVGENNGQLCFVRHHGWHTEACLDQKSWFFGTASVRSWSLDQPLVPGVFLNYSKQLSWAGLH